MPLQGPPLERHADLRRLLEPGLREQPEAPALVSLDGALSWAELDQCARRVAGHYLRMGLQPGDRVASLMPNRKSLIVHYLACLRAGLVATPLNYRYTRREVDHALEVSEARVIVAHVERAADIASSRAAALPLGVVWHAPGGPGGSNLADCMSEEPSAVRFPDCHPRDPCAIFFTSGSTGPAKGVTHSFESLGWMLAAATEGYAITSRDVLLPGSSCSHIAGFGFTLAAFSIGARAALARGGDHAEIGPLLRLSRATFLLMLPAALLHLVREPETTAEDFQSVRVLLCGGDKIPQQLQNEYQALTGKMIRESYGMTEIGFATYNRPPRTDKSGSIGVPNPGFSFSIRDEGGRELPPGAEGRVWAKAPSIMTGYWNDARATAAVRGGDWFDTGDVMDADEEGWLWFRGRRKQIIVHDGSNIAPQEVEEALLEHPAVESAAAVGVRDLAHGENVLAYVELKKDAAPPTAAELIAFARERIGYKAPEAVVFIEAMPLNPTGKVDRTALRRLAEAGSAPGS